MKIIELFSGIGGFTKGFLEAGYKVTEHYFSEIDIHAIANYKYNFPDAKYIGSVTDISGRDFTGIDIITFGSPCQDFSLAGNQKGLEGSRSGLIKEAIRLVTDIRPGIFIWENVKGAFSSNSGQDFWAILQAFANIGDYRLEWQLLNTKWFLPQNRERIYLVGHLAGRSLPGVFPIGENDFLFDETTKSFESQSKYISTTLTAGTAPGMKLNDTFIAGCLTGGGNSGGMHRHMTTIQIGAFRGRNPENKNDRNSGIGTEQFLELNQGNISNCLTSVAKDNVVVGTLRTHNDGKGFRQIVDDNCPTIPARARQDGSGQPIISDREQIRRLTEIECERLQGFPDDWTKYGIYPIKKVAQKKFNGLSNQDKIAFVEEWKTIKKVPATQRYKQLGNAVSIPPVKTIAQRLKL